MTGLLLALLLSSPSHADNSIPIVVERLERDWTGLALCAGSTFHIEELHRLLDVELKTRSESLCVRDGKKPQLVGELESESLCLPTKGPRVRYFASVKGRFVCVK
jgi:hypothetical protein